MDLKKLQAPLERQLSLLGFELLHLEADRDLLRLYIDHADAAESGRMVTLDDCVAANDGLVAWMDVEFPDLREDFGLEISSPGMERPLVRAAHFNRFRGRLCRIQTKLPVNGQKRFKGWIDQATDEAVTIEEDGVLKAVPLDALQKARLAPFDEDGTPKPKHLKAVMTPSPELGPDDGGGVETSADEEE